MNDKPVHFDPFAGRTTNTADAYESKKKAEYEGAANKTATNNHPGDNDGDMDDPVGD